MLFYQLTCTVAFAVSLTIGVRVSIHANPTSDMSGDELVTPKSNKTVDTSAADESGHEEIDIEEIKDKKFLDDAMRSVLDPNTMIISNDDVQNFKSQLNEIDSENMTLDSFMENMDKLSLEVCKTSQDALWDYVTNINDEVKKNKMVRVAAEEDEIKKKYWNIIKTKYLQEIPNLNDSKINRKIRIIKERGTNVQMPQSKQREEIDTMQRIWSRVSVCAYNATVCSDDSLRTMSDIISIFKTSNDSKELAYYWKAYRDSTGRKIRPIFKDYVMRMNRVAESENFTDAGDMWRYAFEDEHFVENVDKMWNEIKPLYDLLHDYVKAKLKKIYKVDLQCNDGLIPAHILGNLWAQEWQAIYPLVAAYPEVVRPKVQNNETLHSKDLFDAVDQFHQSLGFESAIESYRGITDTMATANCLPSSHDMCDGANYRIKWCGEKITDVAVGLSRAARLLGHVQYFKHYRHLPPLYRDGPNPAFHDAISDIVAVQLTSPSHLKTLSFVKVEASPEVTMNHLLWVALEKLPLMAYAYVLDKWRWDVFGNSSVQNWNQHWWDLSYLVSHVLEFQLLRALCRSTNHSGPLHECSIYGQKEAGKLLSTGMSLGASQDWRTVLKAMTGETELSTKGFLEFFSTLQDFLKEENIKLAKVTEDDDMDQSAPIIVGVVVLCLTLFIVLMYCIKKHSGTNVLSMCGLSKNGSLDIVTNETPQGKTNEIEGIVEDKV
ncbi:angiotensin-converting enzyme-like isoform X2 [Leguminivora glycinivorella]|uniref:angiotensin-converting enzyme-like isoform X2 n=1 Tax=Leguminivora glycinivorella TaxID=1035111 RepID=UPI00200FEDF2|nr:angiotensin-converting enzyme-like isoform X2 [Leguminivora glycinivorella]